MSIRILAVASSVAIGSIALADDLYAQDLRAKFAGCYRIEVGPWTPTLGSSAHCILLHHASGYPLTPTRHSAGTLGTKSPAIEHAYSRNRAKTAWSPMDSSGFRVLWSDGFTGADLRLFEPVLGRRGQYFGVVQALSDEIGPIESIPKATVTAWQTQCETDLRDMVDEYQTHDSVRQNKSDDGRLDRRLPLLLSAKQVRFPASANEWMQSPSYHAA